MLERRDMLSASPLFELDDDLVVGQGTGLGEVVYSARFESGVGDEWSSEAWDDSVAPFSAIHGRLSNETTSLTIPTTPDQPYWLVYDMAVIDSMDGTEWFDVDVDGERILHETFHQSPAHGTWTGPMEISGSNYGWSGYWDAMFSNVHAGFTASGESTLIVFSGSGQQSIDDESWGLDDVRVIAAVPGPTVDHMIPAGHSADAGASLLAEVSEPLDPATARDAGNYTLMLLGQDKALGGGDDVEVPVQSDYLDGSTQLALRPATDLGSGWIESDYFMNLGLMGDWVVSANGATVRQQAEPGASFYVSDTAWQGNRFAGRISIDAGATGDDAVGLVLGFEHDAGGEPLSYYLASWRAGAQAGAAAGVTLVKVTGDGTTDPDLWTLDDADPSIEVLAADPGVLWQPGGEYDFQVIRDPDTGTFTLALANAADGQTLTTLTSGAQVLPASLGHVGFYCHSQAGVTFGAERDGRTWDDGFYQLTIDDRVTDLDHYSLDGDADGLAGGDFITQFTIDTVAPVVLGANLGAGEIYVTFDDFGGMDPASVENASNWTLLGSGGDGTFEDGNETDFSDLIQSIVWEAEIGVATLSLAEVPPDEGDLYELRVGAVTDLAGNLVAPPAEPLQFPGDRWNIDTVVWKPFDGGDWNVPAHWSTGELPGPADRVVIDRPGIEVAVPEDVTVKRIHSKADLRISTGTFTVLGNSEVEGALTVANGAGLQAEGDGAVLLGSGTATLDGANLYATDGGQLFLDQATEYVHHSTGNNQDRVIEASGPGSLISLTGASQIHGGTHYDCDLTIHAIGGGRIDVPSVVTIEVPDEGDQRRRGVHVTANGEGSVIDLTGLERFEDYYGWTNSTDHEGQQSQLKALGEAEITLGELTRLSGVELHLDGTGTLDTSTLEWTDACRFDVSTDTTFPNLWKAERLHLAVDGASVDFPEAVDIDQISISVTGGGHVSIPAATAYEGASTWTYDNTWEAIGANSVISMLALTEIHGGTYYDCDLTIQALDGGRINVPSVVIIEVPDEGDQRRCAIHVTANGEGSVIDLSGLERFEDHYGWSDSTNHHGQMSSLAILPGGEVLLGDGEILLSNVEADVSDVLTGNLRLIGNSILGGTGQVTGAVAAAGTSVVRPGGTDVGHLQVVGDYTQSHGATLDVQLGGDEPSGYDQLLVTGEASLTGTLAASLADGFFPAGDDAFTVLSATSRQGAFTSYEGLDLGAGAELSPVYGPATAGFTVEFSSGPSVEDCQPSGTTLNELTSFVVTFSEVIAEHTFTEEDVALEGPAGPITIAQVTPEGDRSFRITLPRQILHGNYTLRVGPEVTDVVGNPMNQDGDQINGEPYVDEGDPGDVFVHTVLLDDQLAPTVASVDPVGWITHPLSLITVSFTEAVTFEESNVTITTPTGTLPAEDLTVSPVDDRTFTIALPEQTNDGEYRVEITQVADIRGNTMATPYTSTLQIDQTAPSVAAVTPAGTAMAPFDRLDVSFDEPIRGDSFLATDVTLTGPEGSVAIVGQPSHVSGTTYRISVATQRANGTYTLVIGADVQDLWPVTRWLENTHTSSTWHCPI